MDHSTTAAKKRHLHTEHKINQASPTTPSLQRSTPRQALLQEIAKRSNHLADLFLEYYCLFKIASTLNGQMDIERTLSVVKKIVRQKLGADQYALMLIAEKGETWVLRSHFGLSRTKRQHSGTTSDERPFGAMLKRRHPVYIPNLKACSVRPKGYNAIFGKAGAFVSLPLIATDGRALGVMSLLRRQPDSFTANEIDLLRKMADQIGKAIDTIALYQHTRELSITDELTGVFNRRYFNQRYEREIQRAQRYGRALSLIMLDIDHFKIFNDTHGHLAGDAVLKQVAKILEQSIRRADILARYGGEEFVVVLPEINKEQGRKVAEKLRRAIERNDFPNAGTQPLGRITISLGVASFPEDARDAEELVDRADQGLYLAKARGRNQVGVYQSVTPTMPCNE
ncbi:MAG: sensor domain-containing diguanylate cyclase [candidate division KSB1 bacterium]|nr:sensor domain-containing diguanylate cyclase [candidate division KSB1 bacterium]